MKKQLLFLSFLVLLSFANIKAQAISSLLTLNPDPHSLALGLGGVANLDADPGEYYFNPALLGYFSQATNFSYQTYSRIPSIGFPDYNLNTNSFTLGYKYKLLDNLNISAGFGYRLFHIESDNNYGNDKYDAYSFGLSLDYFVNLSLGVSFKNAVSKYQYIKNTVTERKANAKDWGLLLTVPIVKLIDPQFTFKPGSMELKPFVNFSLGYSKCNSGDEYDGYYPGEKYLLPLTARLGYNLSFGSDMKLSGTSIQLFNISLMIEAWDYLVDYNYTNGKSEYRSGLGKIKFINLLRWKAAEDDYVSKAKSITLLETVSLLRGSIHYGTMDSYPTNGYAVSSDGIFKMLSLAAYNDNPNIKYILDHFEIKYVKGSVLFTGYEYAIYRQLSSLSVSVKNVSF